MSFNESDLPNSFIKIPYTSLSTETYIATQESDGKYLLPSESRVICYMAKQVQTQQQQITDLNSQLEFIMKINSLTSKLTPTITWNIPTYKEGDTFNTQATISSNVLDNVSQTYPPTFTYNPSLGTVLTSSLNTATVTVNESIYYNSVSKTIIIFKITPTITWDIPSYKEGDTFNTQATISQTYPATFTYDPLLGTVLTSGSKTFKVTVSESDYYKMTILEKTIFVKIVPSITWDVTFGYYSNQIASITNANSNYTSPSFTYSPPLGTVLSDGTLVTVTSVENDHYASTSLSVTLYSPPIVVITGDPNLVIPGLPNDITKIDPLLKWDFISYKSYKIGDSFNTRAVLSEYNITDPTSGFIISYPTESDLITYLCSQPLTNTSLSFTTAGISLPFTISASVSESVYYNPKTITITFPNISWNISLTQSVGYTYNTLPTLAVPVSNTQFDQYSYPQGHTFTSAGTYTLSVVCMFEFEGTLTGSGGSSRMYEFLYETTLTIN
jgi:hypothetical protein